MKALRLLQVAVLGLGAAALTGVGTAAAGQPGSAWTGKVTATRSYLDANGNSHTVARRHITLRVSTTSNLRGRQEINVSWSGAHPTGGTFADVNSGDAANEEYPFVLLECRGVDSAAAANRLRPATCWT